MVEEKDLEVQTGILKLVQETFDEQEVLDVALYIISSLAVGEAVQQGIMGQKKFVENLPPIALDIAYRYESALTDNKFYLNNYTLIKSFVVMDKVKLSAISKLAAFGQKTNDFVPIEKMEHLLHSKLDSLAFVAFLWKGYEFAVDFMMKARLVMELTSGMKEFIEDQRERGR